jgi:hypothetical protein
MVKIAKEGGQICTLNKPLHCPKNGEHLIYFGHIASKKSVELDNIND